MILSSFLATTALQKSFIEKFYIDPLKPYPLQSKNLPSSKEEERYAHEILKLFTHKIFWKDLPFIAMLASHFLQNTKIENIQDKIQSVLSITWKVIHSSEKNNILPSFHNKNLQKMFSSFVELLFCEDIDIFRAQKKNMLAPSKKAIEENFFHTFLIKNSIANLVDLVPQAIFFSDQFFILHADEKKEWAKKYIQYGLQKFEIDEYLIDNFFEEVSSSCIDIITDQLLIR